MSSSVLDGAPKETESGRMETQKESFNIELSENGWDADSGLIHCYLLRKMGHNEIFLAFKPRIVKEVTTTGYKLDDMEFSILS